MAFENITTQTDNHISIITINRPDKLNALNKSTVQEIGQAIEIANGESSIKGIIITGAGPKAFAAGADITEFLGLTNEQGKAMAQAGHDVFNSIERSAKPVIAAVNGFALGGGCELAMACHIRVASENAKFGQPEVNLGLIPGYGGTQRLLQCIGKGKAIELMITADMITAQQALSLGLVNYVVTQESLMAKCMEIFEKVRTKSPVAIKGVINCMNAFYKDGMNGFAEEVEEFGKCFGTEDFMEGTAAFLEKRKADFPGK